MLTLFSFIACATGSSVPEDAIWYAVDVVATGVDDSCGLSQEQKDAGYADSYLYAVAFDGSSATIYIDDNVFASGTISGCNLTYETVEFGQERDTGDVKWILHGEAKVDGASGGSCVDEGDWAGTEWFEITDSEDDNVQVGCEYDMATTGALSSAP